MTYHPHRRRAYCTHNPYGSETSVGFSNTNTVIVFDSVAERDAYVAEHGERNLSVYPITAREAKRLVPPYQGLREYRTADGHHVLI